MFLSAIQSITGLKVFDKDTLAIKGTSTGKNTVSMANTTAGSLESDAVWKIVRIEIAGDGSVVEIKTLNNVKWSDVLTLIF